MSEIENIESQTSERFTVPFEPTRAMWGGLARAIMMWLDFSGPHTPRTLLDHLKNCGEEIPSWFDDESEMKALDHALSKGTRVTLIYKAMLTDCRREALAKMVALDEEIEALPTPQRNPGGRG